MLIIDKGDLLVAADAVASVPVSPETGTVAAPRTLEIGP